MKREVILADYRDRIERGDRIKLTTEERKFLVESFVEDLKTLNQAEEIRARCEEEIALLEQGYGFGSNSTTSYLSKYRKAIEEAVAAGRLPLTEATTHQFHGHKQATGEPIEATNHLAWELMRYDNQVYAKNRRETNVANNQRQDAPQPFVPDRFLDKASELLAATEAETLAVAIAAVTGRRHTEVVVSGSFALTAHPYLLQFDGQLKKLNPIAYPIVTLLPATQVLEAIERFRALPEVQQLAGLSSDDPALKAFRRRVNSRVQLHFQRSNILPLLPGFNSVSVHRLRAAYARMAVYFWLSNQGMNEHRFLQFYLGHVSAEHMRDAPNATATTHYFGYRLMNDKGQEITARGIKLMANPPLPSPSQAQLEAQQRSNQQLEALLQNEEGQDSGLEQQQEEEEMPVKKHLDEIEAIAHQLDALPEKEKTPKGSSAHRHKTKTLEVSIEDLAQAAARLGFTLETGKGKGYQALLHQVLEAVAQGRAVSTLAQDVDRLKALLQDTVAEAELRSVLTKEVAALKQQLQQVQQERDALWAELEQFASIKQDYTQLQAEFAQVTLRLNQFLQLATGANVTPSATTSIDSPATPDEQPTQAGGTTTEMDSPTLQQPTQANATTARRLPEKRIEIAIQALMHHNQMCTDPKDRWFISGNIIAEMSRTNPATKVKPWLETHPEMEGEIAKHNEAMETTQPHHNRGKEKDELRSIYETFEQSLSDS